MNELQVTQALINLGDQITTTEVDGVTFFFFGGDHMFPFATLVTRDNDYDRFSNLDRPGVYRLNFELTKQEFRERFGNEELYDFTALDRLMPHPTYGVNSWVSIINPSPETFASMEPLLRGSYDLAVMRQERKGAKQ
jgi:hypothetical protein